MRKKCPVCGTGKARRDCHLENGELVCSRCCAEMRGEQCGDCPHYEEAMLNAMRRSAGLPNGHFVVEVNPEVEEAVDTILGRCEEGNMAHALEDLERLLAEYPRNHFVCYGLGTIHALLGNDDESIHWLEKAISIFPYMAEAHYNLAVSYKKSGRLGKVIESFRLAIKYANPGDQFVQDAQSQLDHAKEVIEKNEGVDLDAYVASSLRFEAAFECMEHRQWDRALKGFKSAAAVNEKNAPTHGNMGLCLAFLGRKAEALAALDRALAIDPTYEPARENRLGIAQMEEGTPLEKARFESINYGLDELKKARGEK